MIPTVEFVNIILANKLVELGRPVGRDLGEYSDGPVERYNFCNS